MHLPTIHEVTLRDWFAMAAPEHCADFLHGWQFDEPEPQKPEGYDYHARGGSALREESEPIRQAYNIAVMQWSQRRQAAHAVAARWAYADAMLKGRE